MITSKDVFSKRKEGEIDEAYKMATELIKNSPGDEWNFKAYAWCVIDLIKRDAKLGRQQNLPQYSGLLKQIKIDSSDKILNDQIQYTLRLCKPNGQDILKAKALSKKDCHKDSADLYKNLLNNGDSSEEVQTGLAWELYHLAKEMIGQDPPNFNGAKRHLNEYFKLQVKKPSNLHTCILRTADNIAKEKKLNLAVFVRIWGLENLRHEDYIPFRTDDGSTYPSLVENVILRASKDALEGSQLDLQYILPYVDDCIRRYPDNIWFKLRKARILLAVNQNDEALSFALDVVRSKTNEYWTWELLGDIHTHSSQQITLSCYCKALLCSKNINFVSKVKTKLANILISNENYSRAKLEVEEIIKYKTNEKQKIPKTASSIKILPWYETTSAAVSNEVFYLENASLAEELLHSDLPWINGVVGETFTINLKSKKQRRKLYICSSSIPIEISIPESNFSLTETKVGYGIRIKGEFDNNNHFQVYTLEKRNASTDWDLFDLHVGIVDNINTQKKLIHFIVGRDVGGIIPFSKLESRFFEGDAIEVRMSQYKSKQGIQYHTLTATKTDKMAPETIFKSFKEHITEGNGMGFTDDGIFIPPNLMKSNNIEDYDTVSGKAILNYNKKRSSWGWKAIIINEVT